MTYDEKYDAMPLRGKVNVCDAMIREYSQYRWAHDFSRKAGRKFHRHYDLTKDWWKDDTIGVAYKHLLKWWVPEPSKGHKRKTWRDYK